MATVLQVQKHLVDLVKAASDRDRTPLNSSVHFIPVDEDLFEVMLSEAMAGNSIAEFTEELKSKLSTALGSKPKLIVTRYGISCPGAYPGRKKLTVKELQDKNLLPGLLYDVGGKTLKGVLASSFKAIQSRVVTKVLNDQLRKYLVTGGKFNTGHTEISSRFTPHSSLADTPVGFGLNKAIEALNTPIEMMNNGERSRSKVGNALTTDNIDLIKNVLSRLNSLREDFQIHAAYGQFIETKFSKSFTNALLSVSANVVLIQEDKENQEWGRDIEKKISSDLQKILKDITFSNSFEQEAVERIKNTLLGKSKKPNTSKQVTTKTRVTEEKLASISHGKHSLDITTTSGNLINPATNRKLGPSLASLQLIINQHLPHVIAANMGDQPEPGGQRRILNYRTGRFANTVDVERLTMSKEGMITAFYSYMKNPYATFSEGGQQYRQSRDPKKLISDSIREIAQQYVGNRMRAVVV